MGGDSRLPREQVLPVATALHAALKPSCDRIVIAGSLRRQKPDVGDIEIVAVPTYRLFPDLWDELIPEENPSELEAALKALLDAGTIEWDTKVRRNGPSYKRFIVPQLGGMPMELFLCDEEEFGYQCMIRTGDVDFTRAMMTERRLSVGLKPTNIDCKGGAKIMRNGKMVPLMLYSEADLFAAWGLPVLPPCERNEQGVEKLRKGGLR
jgi:DNA polymerase/3'-5' exonuclease PolX